MSVETLGPGFVETFAPPNTGSTEVFVAGGPRGAKGDTGPTIVFNLGETPVGDVDGVNMDYTTAAAFAFLWVFLNGLRMKEGSDYDITGSDSFTFTYPPTTGDTLIVDYVSA